MNKSKVFMIISIIVLILSIGGSLAWYSWVSTNNTSVSLGFCIPEISFIGGDTLNGNGLVPVTDKENGIRKQIDVYLNKTCKEGDSGVMNLYMRIDILPEELKEETFVYEIVKDNEILYSNNFKDNKEGDVIELLTNEVITEDDSIYLVYVYIDGNRDNPSDMANKNFKFTLYGEGTGAVYKENTMAEVSTPSNSDSVFLNTQIARSSIQTITIAEDNTVPEDVPENNTKDISSKGDGSVMLWYTDDDNDGNVDIYLGSENGVIETNTNGQGMFAYLTNVESLDLTNLDTSNITNMSSMFQGSNSLKEIKLSNFDTSNVTSMQNMFNGCSSLTNLDLSSFDTSNVTNMLGMFYGTGVKNLDLNNFDTSNVTTMTFMFRDSKIETIDFSNWDTSNVTSTYFMFNNCNKLTSLDLSTWNTDNLLNMEQMFGGCSSLKQLVFGNFNTSKITQMAYMFSGCSSLMSLDLSSFDTSNVTSMQNMFRGCSKLTSLDISSFNTLNVTSMQNMFNGCSSLTSLDLSSFNTKSVENMSRMFNGCGKLTSLDVSNFDTSSVINMSYMFSNCSSLTELNINSFNTSNVTSMAYMFSGCSSITSLDVSSFDTSNVIDISWMFYYCSELTTIYVYDLWNTSSVTNSYNMFCNSPKLKGGAGTTYNHSYTDIRYAIVDGGTDNPGYLTFKEFEFN